MIAIVSVLFGYLVRLLSNFFCVCRVDAIRWDKCPFLNRLRDGDFFVINGMWTREAGKGWMSNESRFSFFGNSIDLSRPFNSALLVCKISLQFLFFFWKYSERGCSRCRFIRAHCSKSNITNNNGTAKLCTTISLCTRPQQFKYGNNRFRESHWNE